MTIAMLPDTARMIGEARAFYGLPEMAHVDPGRKRQVEASIETSGTYEHTRDELLVGARLAWRNHARCLGRAHWRGIELLDFRHCRTAEEVAEGCWEHLRYSTNGGQVRPVVTVFAAQGADGASIALRNPQLLRYAGYRAGDGSIIGDPSHVELTEYVLSLGWQGSGGMFDLLPLMVDITGQPTRCFDIPTDAALEVNLGHPSYSWFSELGLKWHANPAVCNMRLEIGGLVYTAAPFSGWYVASEIGARNLSDRSRYNMLPAIAERMGLDTSTERSLWKDRALVELTQAVLHSYRSAGVYIVDHHTASKQFVRHIDREHALGRAVPADWAWANPPLSSSTAATFTREFDTADLDVRPNFVSRPNASGCPHH